MRSEGRKNPIGKIKLNRFEDLFGAANTKDSMEQMVEVPLTDLYGFRNHPFHVVEDEKMEETVESIRQYGVLVPAIVRPRTEGGYEIIAGHRRKRASELAGKSTMPVMIRHYSDEEATIIMVDSNIQREDILPSEKAKAYRMKYEAMKHQGSKANKHTADVIGELAGDSGRTVQRYIRLSELVQELLDEVDQNKIPMMVGEKLSYLKVEEQAWIVEAIGNCGIVPSKAQAEQLKGYSEARELTKGKVYDVLVRKEKESGNVTISAKKIRNYFPETYSKEQIENVIYTLLEEWKQKEG